MSIRLMSLIWERFPHGGPRMQVMLALADHGNDEGKSIYPSVTRLSQKVRLSERRAREILTSLEEDAWIKAPAGRKGGRKRTTRYEINVDALESCDVIYHASLKTRREPSGFTDDENPASSRTNPEGSRRVKGKNPASSRRGTIREKRNVREKRKGDAKRPQPPSPANLDSVSISDEHVEWRKWISKIHYNGALRKGKQTEEVDQAIERLLEMGVKKNEYRQRALNAKNDWGKGVYPKPLTIVQQWDALESESSESKVDPKLLSRMEKNTKRMMGDDNDDSE